MFEAERFFVTKIDKTLILSRWCCLLTWQLYSCQLELACVQDAFAGILYPWKTNQSKSQGKTKNF